MVRRCAMFPPILPKPIIPIRMATVYRNTGGRVRKI
jgi:hypothetical protein